MKRALPVALLLCAFGVAADARAQSSVRVGPSAEDSAPAAKKPDAKSPAKSETKPQNKPDPKSAPKGEQGAGETGGGGVRPAAKTGDAANTDAKPGPKSSDPTSDASPSKTDAAASTASVVPVEASNSSATSDAPPKAGSQPVIPPKTTPTNGTDEANSSASKSAGLTSKSAGTNGEAAPTNTPKNTPSSAVVTPGSAPNSAPPASTSNSGNASPANASPAPPSASNTSAAPAGANTVAAAAVAPTDVYRVGAGDVIDVRLLNQVYTRESTLYTVMAGGLLEYPLAGEPVPVGGLTPEEIGARLEAALKRRAVFVNPRVVVSVREYASHTVLVSGLVNEPGVKIIRREAIPLYVVVAEAQPKTEAGRAVVMSHKTGQTLSIDLADEKALNALVYPGDVVNLTTKPQEFFYIGGEIAVPGQKDFHSGMTLTQAVLASGGTTRLAGGKVRVSRQGAGGLLVSTEYNLKLIQDGKVPDPRLEPGDRVEVGRKD